MHVSVAVAQKDILPHLRIIFESNPQMAAGLTDWFDFNEDQVSYIAGGKKQAKAILKSMKLDASA